MLLEIRVPASAPAGMDTGRERFVFLKPLRSPLRQTGAERRGPAGPGAGPGREARVLGYYGNTSTPCAEVVLWASDAVEAPS